jgi:hypothetical protein
VSPAIEKRVNLNGEVGCARSARAWSRYVLRKWMKTEAIPELHGESRDGDLVATVERYTGDSMTVSDAVRRAGR